MSYPMDRWVHFIKLQHDKKNINTLQTTTTSQAAEIDTLETDIAYNASNIVAINNSFTSTTDLLRTDLTSETTNRTNADSTLQSNIDSEAATRLANDNTLQSNIDSEAATRLANDNTLQSNLDAEALSRTNTDSYSKVILILKLQPV